MCNAKNLFGENICFLNATLLQWVRIGTTIMVVFYFSSKFCFCLVCFVETHSLVSWDHFHSLKCAMVSRYSMASLMLLIIIIFFPKIETGVKSHKKKINPSQMLKEFLKWCKSVTLLIFSDCGLIHWVLTVRMKLRNIHVQLIHLSTCFHLKSWEQSFPSFTLWEAPSPCCSWCLYPAELFLCSLETVCNKLIIYAKWSNTPGSLDLN